MGSMRQPPSHQVKNACHGDYSNHLQLQFSLNRRLATLAKWFCLPNPNGCHFRASFTCKYAIAGEVKGQQSHLTLLLGQLLLKRVAAAPIHPSSTSLPSGENKVLKVPKITRFQTSLSTLSDGHRGQIPSFRTNPFTFET